MGEFVQLDKRTWVRPGAVVMVRMGPDNETLIFVGNGSHCVSVDQSISDTLSALDSARLARSPEEADRG